MNIGDKVIYKGEEYVIILFTIFGYREALLSKCSDTSIEIKLPVSELIRSK